MPIFIRGSINQGDDCFNDQSRGKQCAFNSLLGLLTAYKKPITQWSPMTLNTILLQGDKLYLKAMNNHLIHLPPGVIYLSVSDLPKLVIVSCFENELNFDICCQTEQNIDLPVGVDSIELPVVVSDPEQSIVTSNTELPIVVSHAEPPIMVGNTELPIVVGDTEPPIMVGNTESPIVVSDTEPPVVVGNTEPPIMVGNTEPSILGNTEPPIVVGNTEPPIVVGDIEPPIVVGNTKPPIVASDTEPPTVVNKPSGIATNNEEVICVIDYKQELQGLVIINEEIPSHYYKMHIAIANTFVKYEYAFMILESYIMALIKHIDCFYLIDPHGRNVVGMPDPNGTAVVMQFANMLGVEQYLYALSDALHSNSFEIVPVQFTEFVNKSSTKMLRV